MCKSRRGAWDPCVHSGVSRCSPRLPRRAMLQLPVTVAKAAAAHGSPTTSACEQCSYSHRTARYLVRALPSKRHRAGEQLLPRLLKSAPLGPRLFGRRRRCPWSQVEARYDSTRRTLVAKKLTGNDFVGAGKVTWEISAPSGSDGAACKVVSSLWQHVFTPRWDACSVEVRSAPCPLSPPTRAAGDARPRQQRGTPHDGAPWIARLRR